MFIDQTTPDIWPSSVGAAWHERRFNGARIQFSWARSVGDAVVAWSGVRALPCRSSGAWADYFRMALL
jgi:hypothetical protein